MTINHSYLDRRFPRVPSFAVTYIHDLNERSSLNTFSTFFLKPLHKLKKFGSYMHLSKVSQVC